MTSRASIPQPTNDRVRAIGPREYSEFALSQGIYHLPIDEEEEEREEIFNSIISTTVVAEKKRRIEEGLDDFPMNDDNSNSDGDETEDEDEAKADDDDEEEKGSVLVPFAASANRERNVLDLGHGKGIWIDEFLREHEDCIVTGIDVFLGDDEAAEKDSEEEDEEEDENIEGEEVQEYLKKRWNLNAPFAQDRSCTRLLPETFDLINCRCMAEGINKERWPALIRECKALLKPGGRLQMFEPYLCFQSDNGRLADNSASNAWWSWYTRYMDVSGRDARVGRKLERYVRAAGFEKVIATTHRLPIGRWDPLQTALGAVVASALDPLLAMFAIPFAQVAGITADVWRTVLSRATAELHNEELKPYYQLFVVTARRPGTQRR